MVDDRVRYCIIWSQQDYFHIIVFLTVLSLSMKLLKNLWFQVFPCYCHSYMSAQRDVSISAYNIPAKCSCHELFFKLPTVFILSSRVKYAVGYWTNKIPFKLRFIWCLFWHSANAILVIQNFALLLVSSFLVLATYICLLCFITVIPPYLF